MKIRMFTRHITAVVVVCAAAVAISAAASHADGQPAPQPDPADAVDATMPSTTLPAWAPTDPYQGVGSAPPATDPAPVPPPVVPVIAPPPTGPVVTVAPPAATAPALTPDQVFAAATAASGATVNTSASCAAGLSVAVAGFPAGSTIVISDAGLGVNQTVLRATFTGSRSFRVPNPDKGRTHDWLIGTTPVGVRSFHVHLGETCGPKVGADPTSSPVVDPDGPDQTDPGADAAAPVAVPASASVAATRTVDAPKVTDPAADPAPVVAEIPSDPVIVTTLILG